MFDLAIRKTRLIDSLELFIALKEARGLSPASLVAYRRYIEAFIAAPVVPEFSDELSADTLVLWLHHMRRSTTRRGGPPADGTLAFAQRHVYVWIRWLIKRNECQPDILAEVPPVVVREVRRRSLTPDGFVRLLTVAGHRRSNLSGQPAVVENRTRNLAILHLLYSSGVRRNELVQLLFEDLDLRAGSILVRMDKGKRTRVVAFDAATRAALAEYVISDRGREPGPLFLSSRTGQGFTPMGLDTLIKRLAQRAGIEFSCHDARRGFAARVRRAGLDIGHTMTLLGHATPVMTLAYSRAGEEDAAISAYRKLVG